MPKVRKCKFSEECGSVISEFAILVPLLLVFFLGIAGVGQLLGHVTWISQTAYSGALFASDIPQSDGDSRVDMETERLRHLQSRGQVSQENWGNPSTTYTNGALTGKPIVNVSVDAHVSPIVKAFFPMEIGLSVAAAYLVPNQSIFEGFLDFGNPATAPGCGNNCDRPAPYVPGKRVLELPGIAEGQSLIEVDVSELLANIGELPSESENIGKGGTGEGKGEGGKGDDSDDFDLGGK